MALLSPATVYMDTQRTLGEISPLLFGGFAEHLGRCIYEGIYDPASPHADAQGFRKDVVAALKELDFTIMRYPGGNFVSGYHWMDEVGPRQQRPRRRELAWQSLETNQFGTNEFMEFCRLINTQPMLGANFGTGSLDEVSNLVEYCNAPTGSSYADLRASHGYAHPHSVKYWCLGNEMDGPWQIGHLEAEAYARKALEAAKLMRWHDPTLKLILCGSSGTGMTTFPEWDRIGLETCWEQTDYLSLHTYVGNRDNDTGSYLAVTKDLENQVDVLDATLRYVKSKLRSRHDVYLSWDEWNVWYKQTPSKGGWTEAPHLLEEVYNLEDALVVAEWMNVFMRRAYVLKIACLAQIVNVIAPIMTTRDKLVKQTTFYPFKFFRQFARGLSLDLSVRSPQYYTQKYGDVPQLDASASYDPATGDFAAFLVNRSQTDFLPVEMVWQNAAPQQIAGIYQLAGNDPKAVNTFDQPSNVLPVSKSGGALSDRNYRLSLPPLSFTVLTGKGMAAH